MVTQRLFTILFLFISGAKAENENDDRLRVVLNEIDKLKYSNELRDQRISDLEKQVRENRKEYLDELSKQTRRIAELEQRLSADLVIPPYRRARQLNGNGIAFTAYLSKHASNLGHQHTIPFDSVITNEGQAFNTNTFEFTCPVSGIYTFQTALLSQANDLSITEIVKEGIQLVQAHAEARYAGTGFDQGFNSVVTKCIKGESVWVRNFKHYGSSAYSERYTTFTGFLLWETEEVDSVIG